MFLKKKALWQGLAGVFSLTAVLSVATGQVLEANKATIDSALGTQSTLLVSEDGDGLYTQFQPREEFINRDETGKITGYNTKNFLKAQIQLGRRSGYEGSVLLKNENNVLPLAKGSKVTLLGVRSHMTNLGSGQGVDANGQMVSLVRALSGTETDFATEVAKGNALTTADNFQFSELNLEGRTDGAGAGFECNPAMVERYKTLKKGGYNDRPGASAEVAVSEISDVSLDGYKDAAIIVIGRGSSENSDFSRPAAGQRSQLALTQNELDTIAYAKANFEKVVVLVGTNSPMEIQELKDDTGVDSVLWIGHLGCFGSLGVADVLCGRVSPSGALADTYARYGMSSPASVNFGNYQFPNTGDYSNLRSNSKKYVVEAEGIYTGYRYYETRYYDKVLGKGNAGGNSGVWGNEAGEWKYEDEVTYTFGYGLSYTTFKFEMVRQKTEKSAHSRYTKFTVKVTNTGSVAGATPVQIYGQAPYTHSTDLKQLQKPAIQLLEFGKTGIIEPGKSQEVEVEVDWQNIASYDSNYVNSDGTKGTYVLDNGDYYFTVANGAHEAINNILVKQGHTEGLVGTGNKDVVYVENFKSADGKQTDANTFAFSKAGVRVQNQIPYGDYNWYLDEGAEDVVTYLNRNDWVSTYPIEYTGEKAIKITDRLAKDLKGEYYVTKNEDASEIIWGQSDIEIDFYHLAKMPYDDPRWEELLQKMSIEDAITMAAYGGNTFAAAKSVGFGGGKLTENTGNGIQNYLPGNNLLDDQCPWKVGDDDPNAKISLKIFGSAVLMASTFSHNFLFELGEFLGEEGILVGLPIIWGPGGNTHRCPYNGRTGEYYSEDPVLTGVACMEGAVGARDHGMILSPKHYAFNDQETNRVGVAPFITEQRARETELRAFQIAFEGDKFDRERGEDTGMLGMMTSFSKIGGVECTASVGLVRNIAVGEWAFRGYTVTDISDDFDILNMVIMGGCTGYDNRMIGNPSWKQLTTSTTITNRNLETGAKMQINLSQFNDIELQKAIKDSVHRTLYTFCQSVLMNQYNASTKVVEVETSWRVAYKTAIISTAVLAGLSTAAFVVFSFLGKKGA